MEPNIEDYFIKIIIRYSQRFVQESTNSRSNMEYSESESEKELTDENKLVIIDSDGKEITMDKPEKRVITKLSKLLLSKLLDLKEISKLPPDQYKITKNTLFYLKQQETKKIQEILGQDPKTTKENYLNIANSFHDHFNIKIKQLETEGKIGPNTWILFDRSKNDFWPFTWLNVKDPEERKELARFYKATLASFDMYVRFDYELYFTYKKETMIQRQKERSRPEEKEIPQGYLEQLWDIYDGNIEKIYPNYIRIPTDIRDLYYMIKSLFIHEAKGLRRIEEKPITPSMNKYIKNLPITGYTLITPFKLSNSKYQDEFSDRPNENQHLQ
ncbi:21658_t:CDS:2, partial [Gigaspora rosea]